MLKVVNGCTQLYNVWKNGSKYGGKAGVITAAKHGSAIIATAVGVKWILSGYFKDGVATKLYQCVAEDMPYCARNHPEICNEITAFLVEVQINDALCKSIQSFDMAFEKMKRVVYSATTTDLYSTISIRKRFEKQFSKVEQKLFSILYNANVMFRLVVTNGNKEKSKIMGGWDIIKLKQTKEWMYAHIIDEYQGTIVQNIFTCLQIIQDKFERALYDSKTPSSVEIHTSKNILKPKQIDSLQATKRKLKQINKKLRNMKRAMKRK